MTIQELKKRYFWLKAYDTTTQTEPQPQTYDNNSLVTPLFDLKEYIQALIKEIEKLKKGDFLYICGWLFSWVGPDPRWGYFGIDEVTYGPGNKKFIDLLIEKANIGVDVRVLGWVSYAGMGAVRFDPVLFRMPTPPIGAKATPGIYDKKVQGYYSLATLNAITMNSVRELRKKSSMTTKAMLNMLSHPVGSVHVKMAILGNTHAVGFTGGLDLSQWRWAEYGHNESPNPNLPNIIESLDWHDIQVMVQGKAVQAFYDLFRDMWNECLKRPPKLFRLFKTAKMPYNYLILSHVLNKFKPVSQRTLSPLSQSTTQYIQSLRTIPAFNFKKINRLPEGKPFSKAPKGLFEVKAAWKKAILGAKKYIYIEDNSLMSQEVLLWINQAVKNNPNLLVIFVKGGGVDPADPVLENKKSKALVDYTINKGLCKGIESSPNVLDRIRIFQAWGTTVNVCDKLSNNFKKTLSMPVKKVTALSATESIVHTGWQLEDNLAKKIQSVAANQSDQELRKNELRKKAQLRIVGGSSYQVSGNPMIKKGQSITLQVIHGNNPPQAGEKATLHITYGIYVHAKTTIIDDNWAMIGSNNVWRRSLYTDWEHAISFMDDGGGGIKKYRTRLWSEHFKVGRPNSALPNTYFETANLVEALSTWFVGSSFPLRSKKDPGPKYLKQITLPIKITDPKPDQDTIDEVMEGLDETFDPDSRQPWGALVYPSTIW